MNLWKCCSDATVRVSRASSLVDIVAIRQLRGAIQIIGGETARIEDGIGLIIYLGCG